MSITLVILMCVILASMAKNAETPPRKALAANVAYLMAKHGDTQATLAKRAGVTQSNVFYVVKTDRNVRLDTVEAIAAAYGLSGWHLINPKLPTDLLESPSLSRLVDSYINTSPEGRALIDAIAEREAKYTGTEAS